MPAKKTNDVRLKDSGNVEVALKFNAIEANKLRSNQRRITHEKHEKLVERKRDWENIQKWSQDVKQNTGYSDLSQYSKMIEQDTVKKEEETPSYYFMYGMRIGEKPKLMKNFLGNRPQTKNSARNNNRHETTTEMDFDQESMLSDISTQPENEEEYNQIMIDNKVVTQVPIGYTKNTKKKSKWYSPCSSQSMQRKNTRIPEYYNMKYKGLIPPPNMFR